MEENQTQKLTLCDGCILMVIFGIAASLFTPGYTQAVEGRKLSDMVDRVHTVRSCIMLYRAHNGGLLPGQVFEGDAVTPDAFIAALQQQRPDGYGPYLGAMLENPFVTDPARQRTITCVNDADARPTGAEQTAWWFNAATGDFHACDSQFHTNY